MYHCDSCGARLCPGCAGRDRRATRRAAPRTLPTASEDGARATASASVRAAAALRVAEQQSGSPSPLPGLDTSAIGPSAGSAKLPQLLALLRKLPVVRAIPLAKWVPERSTAAYAALRLKVIDMLLDAVDAGLHPHVLEERSLLALALPHLLLRERLFEEGRAGGTAGDQAPYAATSGQDGDARNFA